MSLITDFNSPVLIEFISHVAKEETMKKCFTTLINKKLAVAKSMLNSKVVSYIKSLEESVVIKMTRSDA